MGVTTPPIQEDHDVLERSLRPPEPDPVLRPEALGLHVVGQSTRAGRGGLACRVVDADQQ